MPFDFKAYDAKCNGLTPQELQREWEHYTRLISGASTSTAVSGIAVPFTLGVSTIGVAMAAPAIHNARKKREIIEKHLQKHGATHVTRKRDVLGSMAVSGTIGIVTLGVGSMGADAIATTGAEHGISAIVENETAIKVVTHAALDGAGMGIEHAHTSHLKKKDAVKAFQKAGVFQAVQDAKAAEAGYSIQPYNPQTYASGSAPAQALPSPQYTNGSPMSPPPSYSASPGYAYPSDSKAAFVYAPNSQAQHWATPGHPAQLGAPQQYNSSPTPSHQYGTAVPASAGYNQSQNSNSATQPYSSYVAQPNLSTQAAPSSSPAAPQQYTGNQPLYSQSTARGSITSLSHDAFDMGTLAQSLPASVVASVPTPAQALSPQTPHGVPAQQQSIPRLPSACETTASDQNTARNDPAPHANSTETDTVASTREPTLDYLEQHYAGPQLQQATAYASPRPAGSPTHNSSLHAPQPVTTYNPANHYYKEESHQPATTIQQQTQYQSVQRPTQIPSGRSSQYLAQPLHHQETGQSSQSLQYNTQALPLPPTSTYHPAPTSPVPSSYPPQPPIPTAAPPSTYPLPSPPQSHQTYQPTQWTVPPPPPYPPPVQNSAQVQQQQPPHGPQYAPHPASYAPRSPHYHSAHQQFPQTPVHQQQYQPVSQPFQPQYQAQQQVQQQIYNPLPTPISPPYGAQAVPQGSSGYFTATATAQYQALYNAPKGSGKPQGQGPYTPAATPGIVQEYPR